MAYASEKGVQVNPNAEPTPAATVCSTTAITAEPTASRSHGGDYGGYVPSDGSWSCTGSDCI